MNDVYLNDNLNDDDIPSLVKYLNNPKIVANTLRIPSPYTADDGRNFLSAIRSSSTVVVFAIRLKVNDELIGCCGIHRSAENERCAEIGYWLAESFWQRGLMSEMVKKAIETIANRWENLVRIEANIFPWNTASMRVVEKCGFQFEGIKRKCALKDNRDVDEHLYSLILR